MKNKKENIHVAMLTSQFYPIIGGAEIQCLNLSRALIEQGVHVEVITPRVDKKSPKREIVNGVPVIRLPFLHPAELNIVVWLAFLWKHRNKYDIFHIHLFNRPHTVASWFISKIFRKKTVVKFANTGHRFDLLMTRKDLRPPLSTLTEKAVRTADAIIAICKQVEKELLSNGIDSKKIVSIPNGVVIGNITNIQIRKQRRQALNLPQNRIIVLRIGTLSEKKGIPVLLNAFEKVVKKCSDAYLLSVGGNEIPKELIVYQEQFFENVRFVQNQADILPFYQASDIFVLPSHTEGLSNALLESQSVGLPAVVTSVGGNTDVVKNGINGIVVDYGNAEQLASALIDLIISKEKRESMSREALNSIKQFDLSHIAHQYSRLYKILSY
jgi:glycosyltransferase involved in cell wall biosynthesis